MQQGQVARRHAKCGESQPNCENASRLLFVRTGSRKAAGERCGPIPSIPPYSWLLLLLPGSLQRTGLVTRQFEGVHTQLLGNQISAHRSESNHRGWVNQEAKRGEKASENVAFRESMITHFPAPVLPHGARRRESPPRSPHPNPLPEGEGDHNRPLTETGNGAELFILLHFTKRVLTAFRFRFF